MSTQYFDYKAGLGNVGSYQASAKPFLSSSLHVSGNINVVKVTFPNVSRFVTIKNMGVEGPTDCLMRVGFSENGVNDSNYVLLNNGESYSGDWRLSRLYLRTHINSTFNATASVVAGLTNIDYMELAHNWSGSRGVG